MAGLRLITFTTKDRMLDQTERILKRPTARRRDLKNIRNWIQNTGQIAREESGYLWSNDLITVGASDTDTTCLVSNGLIENVII